jgi:hypothetical protein
MKPEERMFTTKGVMISTSTIADFKKNFVESKPDYDYSDLKSCVSSPMDLNNLH